MHSPRSWPGQNPQAVVLFYQGWAEGANHRVVDRMPCAEQTATRVTCATTVEDDFIDALMIDINVTDTFHLTFDEAGSIVVAGLSSDDPPELQTATAAVFVARPELRDEECLGMSDGGPTPGACARAVIAGLEQGAG